MRTACVPHELRYIHHPCFTGCVIPPKNAKDRDPPIPSGTVPVIRAEGWWREGTQVLTAVSDHHRVTEPKKWLEQHVPPDRLKPAIHQRLKQPRVKQKGF